MIFPTKETSKYFLFAFTTRHVTSTAQNFFI